MGKRKQLCNPTASYLQQQISVRSVQLLRYLVVVDQILDLEREKQCLQYRANLNMN
jgi:hypothetical protein